MLTDPRVGLWGALAAAALSGIWLLIQWPYGDTVFATISYAAYAADLFAIFILLGAGAAALLFWRYTQVKVDLLAGRNVVGRWVVDPAVFRKFADVVDASDAADKRGALLLVLGFIVVIFGAFAVFDPEAASFMVGMAAVVATLIVVAYLWGGRVRRVQLTPRSGTVIVGRDGLLVNDVLHVWRTPLSRLTGVRLESGILTVTYGFLSRMGWQSVDVPLPVPPDAVGAAQQVADAL